VGVQALDSDARAADTAVRAWAGVIRGQGRISLSGIAGVCVGDQELVDLRLGSAHAAAGFETAHREDFVPANQPVAGRHRLAVVEEWCIAEHDGLSCVISDNDFERTLR
jgi:hypothetical protein